MAPDQIDLAAAALGVVEDGHELGSHRVKEGDVIIGLPSPNLRSNGFSLVRQIVADRDLGGPVDGEDASLGGFSYGRRFSTHPSCKRCWAVVMLRFTSPAAA
jgi:hypothetical protein